MEREYQYLLAVLKAFLLEQAPPAAESMDWKKLIHLAQIHCVTGILGYMTMRYPICPDPALNGALRSGCLETVSLFTQRAAAMDQLSQQLEREQIPHIVMKGYVLRECYPVPELRTYGDIDFVIRPADRQRVHSLMLELGFRPETDWEPVFSYVRDLEYYEIHTELMEVDVSAEADCRAYFADLWENVLPADRMRHTFTREYHFLYLLTHLAKHIRGSGAGARMYLDLAAFIRVWGGETDWAWVAGELEKLNLVRFARTVLACVRAWFGVEAPLETGMPGQEVMASLKAFTMEAGVFGHYHREDGLNVLKNEALQPRQKTLLRRLFPPAKEIERRYTYLQGKPWLLPVAWMHRLIRTSPALAGHAREAAVILSADQQEVDRLRLLMEQIGL